MGGGRVPATGDVGSAMDDGTSMRIGSPGPGIVGLDAKGGGAKGAQPSIADRVVGFARRHRGERLGDGECFTLVDRALRAAGAKSAADYGTVSPNADYTWGAPTTLADLRPGDIIQFRDYRAERETVIDEPGGITTEQEEQERPHHSAIVERVDAGGAVTVLEQNIPDGSGPVGRAQLYFRAGTIESGNRTTTIRLHGTWWFFRPEAR